MLNTGFRVVLCRGAAFLEDDGGLAVQVDFILRVRENGWWGETRSGMSVGPVVTVFENVVHYCPNSSEAEGIQKAVMRWVPWSVHITTHAPIDPLPPPVVLRPWSGPER